jgi:hypothetical protein
MKHLFNGGMLISTCLAPKNYSNECTIKKDKMVVIAPIDKDATIEKALATFHLLCGFKNYPYEWQTKVQVLLCSS